jgi:hypothetical protein
VPVNQRSPRHHVIDVAKAVDVLEIRPAGSFDKQRCRADGAERPYRAVDAARQDARGGGEELLGLGIARPFLTEHLSTITRLIRGFGWSKCPS